MNWNFMVAERYMQYMLQHCVHHWHFVNLTIYNALKKSDLIELLKQTEFYEMKWLLPSDSKYYQPMIIAKKCVTSRL